jgi:segregation and condensation protein B
VIVLVESLLFVASGPATTAQLARALEVTEASLDQALEELGRSSASRGVRLQRQGDQVQLVTAPEAASYIERLLGLELSTRLSIAALETLGIIAYRQPVTRSAIESVRGVNCDGVLRTLLHRGLVEPVGRLEQAGRPILYGTTFEFMQYFGFDDLTDLPTIDLAADPDPLAADD